MTTPNLRSLAASWRTRRRRRDWDATYALGRSDQSEIDAAALDAALDALEAKVRNEIDDPFIVNWKDERVRLALNWVRAHILGEKEKP